MAAPQDPHLTPAWGVDNSAELTPSLERRNGLIFLIINLLLFLAAPVAYVDVLHTALCDKLGAGAILANLPASLYLFGSLFPFLLSSIVPGRLDRATLTWSNVVTSLAMATVGFSLLLPFTNTIRIAAVAVYALVEGLSASIVTVYLYQCFGRGTTAGTRRRTLKLTLALTPMAGVASSLGVQFVMNRGIAWLNYPSDFAFLFFCGAACTAGCALFATRFRLSYVAHAARAPVPLYLYDSLKSFVKSRQLLFLWLAFASVNCVIGAESNLALYARNAIGKEPKEVVGAILALRFGFKMLGGYSLGVMAMRWGDRAPLMGTGLLAGAAILWAWFSSGYWYLLAFGLIGAAEIGGNYFRNYMLGISPPQQSTRNQSLLLLAHPAASPSPTMFGALSSRFGFNATFEVAIAAALLGLGLMLKIPARPKLEACVNK